MEYKVEKDIPIPAEDGRGFAKLLRSLEVGDSVLVPLSKRNSIGSQAAANNVRVVIRREGDQIRLWRVA